MCLRKARVAAAGVKRRLRCEGTRGDQSNKALQTTAKNLDLILMQERPRHIAVEGVGSGVEILMVLQESTPMDHSKVKFTISELTRHDFLMQCPS